VDTSGGVKDKDVSILRENDSKDDEEQMKGGESKVTDVIDQDKEEKPSIKNANQDEKDQHQEYEIESSVNNKQVSTDQGDINGSLSFEVDTSGGVKDKDVSILRENDSKDDEEQMKGGESKVTDVIDQDKEEKPSIKNANQDEKDQHQECEIESSVNNKQLSTDQGNINGSLPSSSSESEDEEDLTLLTGRTRGRGRRGRQDADAKREEMNVEHQQHQVASSSKAKTQDERRCIGRKPLTDFLIGQKYSGKVVYVKPNLGIFVDIGCHSDAFVHISRASDEYIESIEDIFKVGDELNDNIRIVDINRRNKKITASLQSGDKILIEEKSNEAWKNRRKDRQQKDNSWKEKQKINTTKPNDFTKRSFNENSKNNKSSIFDNHRNNESNDGEEKGKYIEEEIPLILDPDTMTPAELKRVRKLQRRAERRKQMELTGISA